METAGLGGCGMRREHFRTPASDKNILSAIVCLTAPSKESSSGTTSSQLSVACLFLPRRKKEREVELLAPQVPVLELSFPTYFG